MKLKIVSDGTRRGTKVVNAETGESLPGIVAIRWEFDLGKFSPKVTLELTGNEIVVELAGEARFANSQSSQ